MILLGNLFVNITLAGVIHAFLRVVLPGRTALLTMAVATATIVIFGEMLPKNIALKHNETIAYLIALPLSGLTFLCSPLLLLLSHINGFFLKRFRMRLRRPSPFITVDEMKSGVMASRNTGAISVQEQDLIVRLLDRGSQPVRNFMKHRSNLVLMPRETLCAEALTALQKMHQLFVLVYEKNTTDRVIGMVHLGTLLRCAPTRFLHEAVKPLQWIPAGMAVAEAIELLFEKGSFDAGIIDEYGSFCGLFSLFEGLRNMAAPLFSAPPKPCIPAGGKTRLIKGDTAVESMAGWLPPSLEKRVHLARTVNGLLAGYLGYIPQPGDKFAIDGWNFYIISASPVKIVSAIIKKKESL